MTWDWKKLFDSEEAQLEEPSPEEAPAATDDSPEQTTKGSSGAAVQAPPHYPSVETERAAGLLWQTTGTNGTAGRARGGRLPQLLYGQEHDCAFCKGTGMMKSDNLCPVCHGSGKVSLTPPVVRCGFCHGKGKKTLNCTVTCLVCKGKGVVTVTPPIKVCPNCNGRGRQRGHSLYCGLCRGTGVITVKAQEQGIMARCSDVA